MPANIMAQVTVNDQMFSFIIASFLKLTKKNTENRIQKWSSNEFCRTFLKSL
jgi:hypothetical protein